MPDAAAGAASRAVRLTVLRRAVISSRIFSTASSDLRIAPISERSSLTDVSTVGFYSSNTLAASSRCPKRSARVRSTAPMRLPRDVFTLAMLLSSDDFMDFISLSINLKLGSIAPRSLRKRVKWS